MRTTRTDMPAATQCDCSGFFHAQRVTCAASGRVETAGSLNGVPDFRGQRAAGFDRSVQSGRDCRAGCDDGESGIRRWSPAPSGLRSSPKGMGRMHPVWNACIASAGRAGALIVANHFTLARSTRSDHEMGVQLTRTTSEQQVKLRKPLQTRLVGLDRGVREIVRATGRIGRLSGNWRGSGLGL